MSTVQSRKAKGRRLQQYVRDSILSIFPTLTLDDVRSTPMGVSGSDIQLSTAAKELFPFDVECKNTESLNVWKMMEQSEKNSKNIPLGVFKRNHSKTYAVLEFDVLMNMLKESNK